MQTTTYFKRYRKTITQTLLFLSVGVMTLLIDVIVTKTLYSVLHMPATFASAIGFLSGFCVNFPLNRKKVFNHSNDDRFTLRAQALLYSLLSIFNLFATSWIVGMLVELGVLEIQYAKIMVTAIFAVWNFVLFKFVIFSKKESIVT